MMTPAPSRDYYVGGLVNDLQEFPEDVFADPADPVFDEPETEE